MLSIPRADIVQIPRVSQVEDVIKIGEKTARAIEGLQALGCKLGYDLVAYPDQTQKKLWWIITPNNRKIIGKPELTMHYFYRVMHVRLKRKYTLEDIVKPMITVN